MILSIAEISNFLNYDPITGNLTWIVSRGTIRKGSIAGSKRDDGYLRVCLFKRNYFAHRVAWGLHYGEWPQNVIDHIDGDRENNKIYNLRDVTVSENGQNRRTPASNSTTGYLGVCFDKKFGKFKAAIKYNGRNKSLGHFETAQEAAEKYKSAKLIYHITQTADAKQQSEGGK